MNTQERIEQIEAQNDGRSIHVILEKYWFQRNGEKVPIGKEWAESEEEEEKYEKERVWANNGKLTGIRDDEEFYSLQRAVYKKVIMIVEKRNLDYKAIASRIYSYLKTRPKRTEISTHEAVDKVLSKPEAQYADYKGYTYFYGGTFIEEDDFWDIHNSLMGKIRMGHKYEADFSKYDGECVGLPYNIPFVFKLKNK